MPGELHDCIGDVQRAAVGLRCAFSNRIGMFRPCRSRLSCTNGGDGASNYQRLRAWQPLWPSRTGRRVVPKFASDKVGGPTRPNKVAQRFFLRLAR